MARTNGTSTRGLSYTVPGLRKEDAATVVQMLQGRLNALNSLALVLKHIHWNVVGTHFIAVHTMLDPQVEAVRAMVDATAERMATLGGSPVGTPAALAEASTADYKLGRADAIEHLRLLDEYYSTIIEAHRGGIVTTEKADPVTQDMLIEQTESLELFQWFVRAHLETGTGSLT
jgi:starvation-inducible DNA-binding protein